MGKPKKQESTVDWIELYSTVNADEGSDWHWRAKAGNGEIVSQGEGHGSMGDALRAAGGVHPNVPVFQMIGGKKVPVEG